MASSFCFAIILTALTLADSWVLHVSKATVTPHLTHNVTLTCCNGNETVENNNGIISVYRIRLLKFTKHNAWKNVAILASSQTMVKTSLTDANVNGWVDTSVNSYLKVTFDVATDQSIGQFICEVDGFDANINIQVIKTMPVLIEKEMANYDELLRTLLDIKKNEEDNVNILKENVDDLKDGVDNGKDEVMRMKRNIDDIYQTIANISSTQQQIIGHIEALTNGQLMSSIETILENKISKVQNYVSDRIEANKVEFNNVITDRISTVIANFTEMQHTIASQINRWLKTTTNFTTFNATDTMQATQNNKINIPWPEGTYLLPEPNTGCPNTRSITWQQSSIRISTGPASDKKDSASRNLSLVGNVLQEHNGNSYVFLKSCKMSSGGQGVKWPSGNYCIQGYMYNNVNDDDRYCPDKFHYGVIRYGRYDDGMDGDDVFNMDVYRYSGYTYIPYCCRRDGSVNDTIVLPSLSPFYLYRYGSECQQVANMTVTNQWIHLGTGRWGYGNNYYSTDGWIDMTTNDKKGVRIDMCYYTPRG